MSPDKKKRLNILRKKLDSLDNKLIKLIKQRTNIVSDVLKLKRHKYEIVDKKRISIILKNIKNKSIKNNIDPKITNKIRLDNNCQRKLNMFITLIIFF